MGDYELVIKGSKRLERLLERELGATGRGLHEKVTSVQGRLPPPLVKRLRFIATIRNRLVHQDGMERLNDRGGFRRACRLAERELKGMAARPGSGRWRAAAAAVVAAAVALGLLWWWLS